jgi:hypothetical protein
MRMLLKLLVILLALVVLLGIALAVRIYTWGRPLPVAYRQASRTPADAESGRSVAYLHVASNGGDDRYVTIDSNNDGTVDTVLREGAPESFARPKADDPEARWLVVCLDGVPYGELAALWDEGFFREFFRPVPLISPFPTASGIALSEAFHTAPVQGYEDGYFDIGKNRLVRGELVTTTGEKIPYLELLDYDMPGYLKGPAYILPHRSYRADLGRFRKRFQQSEQRVYLLLRRRRQVAHHGVLRSRQQPDAREARAVAGPPGRRRLAGQRKLRRAAHGRGARLRPDGFLCRVLCG